MYHYTLGGLQDVYLVNGYAIKQTPHGEAVAFVDGEGLERAICDALARKEGHLSGAELRYIRMSGLKMSQAGVGAVLGVDAQTVARWEKGEGARMAAEKLLRVVYLAHSKGDAPVRSVVQSINAIERAMNQTIVLHERQGLWEATTKDVSAQQDAVA